VSHDSLAALFARTVAHSGPRVALADDGVRVSYGELDVASARIAGQLRVAGVNQGDRVGLCVDRGFPAVAGSLGILKSGAAYVPLDPSYPEERLRFLCEDSRVRLILASPGAPPLDWANQLDFDACLHSSAAGASLSVPQPVATDPAYVIYTSGSTGRPKGVVVTHRNVLALLDAAASRFDFGPDDVWTLFHSYSFDFSVWEMWMPIYTAACMVGVSQSAARAPHRFIQHLRAHGVTVLNQVPSVFRHMTDAYLEAGAPALALRYVIFGGEAVDLATIAAFDARCPDPRPAWVNMYGITETTVHVTYKRLSPHDLSDRGPTPIGAPLPHLQVHLLDSDFQPVSDGEIGEMWVSGAGVADGYLNRPELTAERFAELEVEESRVRAYRTGDLGRRRSDGGFEYLGRADNQVKLRGFRIELEEIEHLLREHPDAREVAATVVDGPVEPMLACLVVLAYSAETRGRDMRRFLAGQLPGHMVPSRIVAVDALPLTPTGKLDRVGVKRMAAELVIPTGSQ
jgi:amino acid adenylation domain-containing protein